jgi:hypothetical protein
MPLWKIKEKKGSQLYVIQTRRMARQTADHRLAGSKRNATQREVSQEFKNKGRGGGGKKAIKISNVGKQVRTNVQKAADETNCMRPQYPDNIL